MLKLESKYLVIVCTYEVLYILSVYLPYPLRRWLLGLPFWFAWPAMCSMLTEQAAE